MFLTGEFSHISRVFKRLLHYYDEIGLLKPAKIDPHTGYRYYSASQLPRLNRILALRDLGLSLDHIALMMQADVSDEEIHGMLLMKKAELEQTLQEDIHRLRAIEARILQNRLTDDALDVVVKSIPAQLFLSIRTILPSPEEMLQLVSMCKASCHPKSTSGFSDLSRASSIPMVSHSRTMMSSLVTSLKTN